MYFHIEMEFCTKIDDFDMSECHAGMDGVSCLSHREREILKLKERNRQKKIRSGAKAP
jgi:hypothetical protein